MVSRRILALTAALRPKRTNDRPADDAAAVRSALAEGCGDWWSCPHCADCPANPPETTTAAPVVRLRDVRRSR
jgi:hypothetical protein